jgi:hypothetical protein
VFRVVGNRRRAEDRKLFCRNDIARRCVGSTSKGLHGRWCGALAAGDRADNTTSTNQPQKWDWSTTKRETDDRHARRPAAPDEFRRKMARVDREFADARRYLSALYAEDNQALVR